MKAAEGNLAGYFDLQLRLAEALARRSGAPLEQTVSWYTNLHRRFGLGILREPPESPEWQAYLTGLRQAPDHPARLAWTLQFHRRCGPQTPPPGGRVFGCFGCEAPDETGTLRIHFANRDRDGSSPLAPGKVPRRREELTDLFGFVARTWPDAGSVRGTSWLYHLEAYRRLFPPGYVASRRAPERLHFHGSSSWGQFLDHQGQVKPGPRKAFLDRLEALDPDHVREAFPLPALAVTAPMALFYAHYRIEAPALPP